MAILAAGLAVGAYGCGEDDRTPQTVALDAATGTALRFERDAVEARSGPTSLVMANPADIPHAIAIRGTGVDEAGETVGRGGTSRVEVDLEPGRYVVFCPVGGHEEAGMTATLTVR